MGLWYVQFLIHEFNQLPLIEYCFYLKNKIYVKMDHKIQTHVHQDQLYLSTSQVGWECPRWHRSKEFTCQCKRGKRHGFDSWVRKITGEGNGNLLQYTCLENPMNRGAWWAIVHGVTKSQRWLSTYVSHMHTGWLNPRMQNWGWGGLVVKLYSDFPLYLDWQTENEIEYEVENNTKIKAKRNQSRIHFF